MVADGRMISADTIAALENAGMEYVLGARELQQCDPRLGTQGRGPARAQVPARRRCPAVGQGSAIGKGCDAQRYTQWDHSRDGAYTRIV